MFGSSPMATNSVEPMPKPPRASASSAKRIRAGDNVVGPSVERVTRRFSHGSNRFDIRMSRRVRRLGPHLIAAATGSGLAEGGLEPLDLAVELAGVARPDVRLQDEGDTRAVLADGLGGAPDDVDHLVPFALDGREHRVGAVGRPPPPPH